MKKVIIYLLLATYCIFASEVKNNQTIVLDKVSNLVKKKVFVGKNIKQTNNNLEFIKFIDSISFGFGQNKSNKNVFKLGVQKEFTSNIYASENGYLKGFYDLSFNKWEYEESDIYGLALSPVFEYYFRTNIQKLIPFIHIGMGVTYITKTSIDSKEFSTHFQFEDRIGFGLVSKKFKISFDYFHYSNGSIKKPNDGMDILLVNYIYKF